MLKETQTVAILGASSGIGAALAVALSRPGRRLFLAARRKDRLEEVAIECRGRGAAVEVAALDVRKPDDVEAWVQRIDDQAAVDLLICCAGVFDGSRAHGAVERNADAVKVVETNLTGPIVTANTMAARMKVRGRGHIALTSSLAALIPQADAAAYSASKAGLTAYAAALRELVFPFGVSVTVIHPGHVETGQTEQQIGRLPLLMTPEAAAGRIVAGLDAGRPRITFPITLAIYAKIYALMPFGLKRMANAGFRFFVRDPAE